MQDPSRVFPGLLVPTLCLATTLPVAAWLPAQPVARPRSTEVPAVSHLPSPPEQDALDGLFSDWSVYQLDLETFAQAARAHGRIAIRLDGRLYELEPADLRGDGFREVWIGGDGETTERLSPVGTFADRVTGEPAGEVRLLILPDLLQGYIRTGERRLFLDPMVRFGRRQGWPAGVEQAVLYEEADVRPGQAPLCGTEALDHAAASTVDVWEAEIATEADFEYHQIYGSSTNSRIAGIVNQVGGISDDEPGLKLKIPSQSVWTSSSDPYSSNRSLGRLEAFQGFWNFNRLDVKRELAHLFSGVDLDPGDDIVGRADAGVVCNELGHAYGVSEDYSLVVELLASEIGHNFDARHDDELDPPTATCDDSGPIICSVIQRSGTEAFSGRSKIDVGDHIDANRSCLTRIQRTPTACFSKSGSGSLYSFDASCSFDPNGSVVSYHWAFEEGGTGRGEAADHFYRKQGNFVAALAVTDDDGETDTRTDLVTNCFVFDGRDGLCTQF